MGTFRNFIDKYRLRLGMKEAYGSFTQESESVANKGSHSYPSTKWEKYNYVGLPYDVCIGISSCGASIWDEEERTSNPINIRMAGLQHTYNTTDNTTIFVVENYTGAAINMSNVCASLTLAVVSADCVKGE